MTTSTPAPSPTRRRATLRPAELKARWLQAARRGVLRQLDRAGARRPDVETSPHRARLIDAWRWLHADVRPGPGFRGIAVDFETSGLDPARDHLLSIGWVPIDDAWIRTDQAREIRVRSHRETTAANAAVHGILDDERRRGEPVAEALAALMAAASGRVWILHFAAIERRFLDHLARRNRLPRPIFPWIDTLELALARDRRAGHVAGREAYRLSSLRARFGFPATRAHHALSDALATAELWLALAPQGRASGPDAGRDVKPAFVAAADSRPDLWHGPGLWALSVAALRCATLRKTTRWAS